MAMDHTASFGAVCKSGSTGLDNRAEWQRGRADLEKLHTGDMLPQSADRSHSRTFTREIEWDQNSSPERSFAVLWDKG